VISCVGDDELGSKLVVRLRQLNVPVDLVTQSPGLPTGTVSVTLNGNGIPHYTIHEPVAWDCIPSTSSAQESVRNAQVVCFGSLAQRSRESRDTIQGLVSATPRGALRVFDINLRQQFYSRDVIGHSLRLANVLKLNEAELSVLASMFELSGSEKEKLNQLAAQFELPTIALTRGDQGSLLYHRGSWSECSVQPVAVVDTVGAGDAFTAALVKGLLLEMEPDDINTAANEVARHVCSCVGATPPLPDALRRLFTSKSDSGGVTSSQRRQD